MRRDKTIARILLIFSVANIALAAPVVGQRHIDAADAVSGKREGSDDGATDKSGSEPMPELVSDSDESGQSMKSESSTYFSTLESSLGSPRPYSPPPPAWFYVDPESSRNLPTWPFDSDSTTGSMSSNGALKKKLMIYGALGAAAAISAGAIYAVQKKIKDNHSPHTCVLLSYLPFLQTSEP